VSVLEVVRGRYADFGPTLACERCTLLVYVDDATSSLLQLYFCDGESTFNYFEATRRYLVNHGKPVAFYSDKASVFRSNRPEPQGGDGVTQFGRALDDPVSRAQRGSRSVFGLDAATSP
jgi:hypothetical protein